MTYWHDKRVVVTGGTGFLGCRLCGRLLDLGVGQVDALGHEDYDLEERFAAYQMVDDLRPDVLIHLAAVCGGIGANQAEPFEFLLKNLRIAANVIDAAADLPKVVTVGSCCAYPLGAPQPFSEADLWAGYPEPTNAPYGIAKRVLCLLGQTAREQYAANIVHVIPANLYGPGDNFNLSTSHVIPAIIRKCLHAVRYGECEVRLWGTGDPTRDFLYVDDAAAGIIAVAEQYDAPQPINLGSGVPLSIREVAGIIGGVCGWEGPFAWDAERPDGQPRRYLDVSRAAALLGWRAETPFVEGIERTADWYRSTAWALH